MDKADNLVESGGRSLGVLDPNQSMNTNTRKVGMKIKVSVEMKVRMQMKRWVCK